MPRLLFMLLSCVAAGLAGAQPIVLYVDTTPGLISSPDQGRSFVGPGAALLARISEGAQLELRLQLAPLARSTLEARSQPNTCAVGLAKDPQWLDDYKWAGPLSRSRLVIYARHDSSLRIGSVQDLRGARVGVARHSLPAKWAAEQGLSATQVTHNLKGLQMLNSGRIDFWAVNELPAQYAIRQSEAPPPRLVYTISVVETFLACNRQLPDAVMARIDQAIARIASAGGLAFAGIP